MIPFETRVNPTKTRIRVVGRGDPAQASCRKANVGSHGTWSACIQAYCFHLRCIVQALSPLFSVIHPRILVTCLFSSTHPEHFSIPFVFNNSSRAPFIFNIFLLESISNLDRRVGEPPPWAQAGILHPFRGLRILVCGSLAQELFRADTVSRTGGGITKVGDLRADMAAPGSSTPLVYPSTLWLSR
jgi:hypothetical protein